MKKIPVLLLFILIGLSSCKKFLHEVPSDAMFLEDLQAVKQTLAAYLINFSKNARVNQSDAPASWPNFQYGTMFNSYANVWAFTTWNSSATPLTESQKRTLDRGLFDTGEWQRHYNIIGLMTLILTEAETARGTDEMRNYVMGEAFIHRAYSFFKLLQYYCPTDNPALGLPVMLDIHADYREADLSRKPQKEVYDVIINDLLKAEELLGRTAPRKTYNIVYSYDFVYRILSQVYLWKASTAAGSSEDWVKAAHYADLAINSSDAAAGALPYDLPTLKKECHSVSIEAVLGTGTPNYYPEALYYFSTNSIGYTSMNWNYNLELWKELYPDNDLRKKSWFLSPANQTKPVSNILQSDLAPHSFKFASLIGYNSFVLFRLSEQYLIWIEALAHTDFAMAKEKLKLWQATRYGGDESEWFAPSSSTELITWLIDERKREFLLEGDIIWLDMKRFHVSETRGAQGYEYTLTPNDFRYQFRIPNSETEKNPTIELNPGWENLEVY